MDEDHYKHCTVHLRTKKIIDYLPSRLHLRQFLRPFGSVLALCEWCFRDGKIQDDKPNNVLVLFEHQRIASNLLKASATEGPTSFWMTHNVIALPVQGPSNKIFYKEMVPKIEKLKLNGIEEQSSGSREPTKRPYWAESSHISDGPIPHIVDTRPTKRMKIGESAGTNENNSPPVASSSSKYVRTPSTVPESTEWMNARIMQLESELESARAARDLAISEQRVAVIAHQAEQQARREAMAEKSAAEAAQSRAEAEQMRLRSELENLTSQKSMPPAEGDNLALLGSDGHAEVLGDLKKAGDQEHKIQLRRSHLESELEKAKSGATPLDKANTEIDRLKSDLVLAREQLDSTQRSLESLERKYSSTRRKYENSKEKLGTYKNRLENERTIVKKLQETLTPAAYKSLGATHETLGEFLSAMGLPPVRDEGNTGPKEESD
ncbi:hypothetical protein RSOLAG22IIIB_00867 [Rhizoctonia solani]|uniref:Uncharacterized protein n=1 Tax=Rhizoctonia solani TaxID=456999 RepID=A0A0K6G1E9_9AGAM|nr:hypothetical protein RSOLAG22IIIB_00867 [Rhizoctonia solani]